MDDSDEAQFEDVGDVENDLLDDLSDGEKSGDEEIEMAIVSEVVDTRAEVEIFVTEVLIVDPTKWSTVPFLTEYEYTSIISKRATMLQTSNDACFDDIEGMTPEEIAVEEIRRRCCPFAVKRRASEKPITYDFIPVNHLLQHPESLTWIAGGAQ